eukprot:TRINITY_DN17929_c0_g1_i1.p1 TRINITY_DN17929_c0_g1~~TRINITY_DN17929_c0_g1_i1.p1  ORF type:complete len:301 (+),score=105.82 TRINITY_DN17929_c0_g1_i1:113-1015(+)
MADTKALEAEYFAMGGAPCSDRERDLLADFVAYHHAPRKIALVTSGGTTVPLERNTVRFIDNFSKGSRGAASAELFLRAGYAVIFMHRTDSKMPFQRKITGGVFSGLTMSESGEVVVKEPVKRLFAEYEQYRRANMLLCMQFTSVDQYLHLLKATCVALAPAGCRALLYAAAAVSDFFIPANQLPTHKIQSSLGGLKLDLKNVPKLLPAMRHIWAPHAFIVSFKLETDPELLRQKATTSLEHSGSNVVVANLLPEIRTRLCLYDSADRAPQEIKSAVTDEIEVPLIQELVRRHADFSDAK